MEARTYNPESYTSSPEAFKAYLNTSLADPLRRAIVAVTGAEDTDNLNTAHNSGKFSVRLQENPPKTYLQVNNGRESFAVARTSQEGLSDKVSYIWTSETHEQFNGDTSVSQTRTASIRLDEKGCRIERTSLTTRSTIDAERNATITSKMPMNEEVTVGPDGSFPPACKPFLDSVIFSMSAFSRASAERIHGLAAPEGTS